MQKLDALARAAALAPDDDAARLAYADALGGPEAALVRVQVSRARLPAGDPRDGSLAREEQALWLANEKRWLARLQATGAHSWSFDRGLVTRAGVTALDLFAKKARLLRDFPALRELSINVDLPKQAREVLATPELLRLPVLQLAGLQSPACWKVWLASDALSQVADLRVLVHSAQAPALRRGQLRGLSSLRLFDWSPAALAETLPAMGSLRELTADHFAMTRAHVEAIVSSGVLQRIRRLELYAAGLSDGDLAPLWAAPAGPTSLSLLANPITGRTVEALADSPLAQTIETLDLGYCPVGPALAALGRLPRLRELRLRHCAADPREMEALAGALGARLTSLEMGAESLLEVIPSLADAPLAALAQLRLSEASLDGASVERLARAPWFTGLSRLSLQHNPLGDRGVRALTEGGRLSRLRSLDLEFCGVGDEGGRALAAWPLESGLSTLDVNGNHLLAARVCEAITARFGPARFGFPGVLLGYQHPLPAPKPDAPLVVAPVPAPKHRPLPAAPPRRRDRARGLAELRERPHFATWDGFVDAKVVAATERCLHDAVAGLLALGEGATAAQQRAVLKKCVTRLNALDAKHNHLQTIERETVDEEFALIARYTPLAAHQDEDGEPLFDAWRDF